MALGSKDGSSQIHSGFTFKGKEIVLSKTRGRPLAGIPKRIGWYDDKKRIEAVTIFACSGNATEVQRLTGVPSATFRGWLKEEWCQRLLDEIRSENDQVIDAKFTQLVESALDKLGDRLQNGDFVVTRHGDLVRKPVGARDLALVTAINIDKRQLLRGKPTSRQETVSVENRLEKLVTHFTQLASKQVQNRQPIEITDVKFTEIKENAEQNEETSTPDGGSGT